MDNFPNIQISMAAGEPTTHLPGEPAIPSEPRTCPDCGTVGTGLYCTQCGEVLEPALPSVLHYVKELLNDIVAFDSKLVRTIPALLFRPGFLTTEYFAGRRKRYLVPSRIYLLTALLVFFAFGSFLHKSFLEASSHSTSHVHYSFGQVKGEEARHDVDKLLGLAVTVSPYVILIASTPIFAMILRLLYRKKRPLFVEHLIFSFHFFAFALIALIAGILLSSGIAALIGFALFLIYLYFAMRKVYSDSGFGLVMRFATASFSYFALALVAIIISFGVAFFLGIYTGDLPDVRNSSMHNSKADSLMVDSIKHAVPFELNISN